MSDSSSQTAANKPAADPVLCKMGCGFFGSATTGDCCSKCWRDLQKKVGSAEPAQMMVQPAVPAPKPMESVVEEPQPMDVEEFCCKPVVEEKKAVEEPATKKKKKKTSYKNMMAGMMKSSPGRDIEKEKEVIRKVTGGGAFSKIDKI